MVIITINQCEESMNKAIEKRINGMTSIAKSCMEENETFAFLLLDKSIIPPKTIKLRLTTDIVRIINCRSIISFVFNCFWKYKPTNKKIIINDIKYPAVNIVENFLELISLQNFTKRYQATINRGIPRIGKIPTSPCWAKPLNKAFSAK